MDLSKEQLSDRDVEMTLLGWEAMKPQEPNYPEPLFVWPRTFGVQYFIRIFKYKRQMKQTKWDFFHQRYQQWIHMLDKHFFTLATGKDHFQDPQLLRLRAYLSNARIRLRENAIGQDEWDRQKSARR
jgi:hypothetical protein